MKVKVIEVIYHLFKNELILLKDDNIDMQVYPVVGDIVTIDDIKYRVLQRNLDFRKNWNNQSITYHVTKCN